MVSRIFLRNVLNDSICDFSSLAVYNAGGLFGGRFSLYITLSLAVYNAGSGHSRCL